MPQDEATAEIQHLLQWSTANGAFLHENVEIYQDTTTGLSFRAVQAIPPNTVFASCSNQITLSYLNAVQASPIFQTSSPSLPSSFLDALNREDPNVIGNFFFMQQYLMGDQSFWWPYIRSLPQPNDLQRLGIPTVWPEDDQKFLMNTNAEPTLKQREKIWREAWTKGYNLLIPAEFPDAVKYDYNLYKWAAGIFESRSFRPSLTISLPRQWNEVISEEDQVLIEEHIRRDQFAMLLPLIDIGNHNGIKQVEWKSDTNALSLVHTTGTAQDAQIFNYYGDKSNSELLVGYGFLLPPNGSIDKDLVIQAIKPSPEKLLLRQKQACHYLLKPSDLEEPEQLLRFHVRRKPNNGSDPRIKRLHVLSHGIIDLLLCMVANNRERQYINQHCNVCPETQFKPFEGPLARGILYAIFLEIDKLEGQIKMITDTNANLGIPQNNRQSLALTYRNSQLSVLKSALSSLQSLIETAIYNPPVNNPNSDKFLSSPLISIELAYMTFHSLDSNLHDLITCAIASDQEETLPLDWAIFILEDWNDVYWILLIYLLALLHKFNQVPHSSLLYSFISRMKVVYPMEVNWSARGSGEWEAARDLLVSLRGKEDVEVGDSDLLRECRGAWKGGLLHWASHVVLEESFVVPYKMESGSKKGEMIRQMVLLLGT